MAEPNSHGLKDLNDLVRPHAVSVQLISGLTTPLDFHPKYVCRSAIYLLCACALSRRSGGVPSGLYQLKRYISVVAPVATRRNGCARTDGGLMLLAIRHTF